MQSKGEQAKGGLGGPRVPQRRRIARQVADLLVPLLRRGVALRRQVGHEQRHLHAAVRAERELRPAAPLLPPSSPWLNWPPNAEMSDRIMARRSRHGRQSPG